MKRLLLSTLIALTAAPALPAFAEAREAPRCERPADRPGAERRGQRPDCPPSPREEGRAPRRNQDDRHPAPPHQERHSERRVEPHAERRAEHAPDWRPGQAYRGHGQRIDHRRADLPAPPRGQHWIREGERYLLVSDDSGIIRSVMARALR